jgi:uncharacterized protein (DUF305 family)
VPGDGDEHERTVRAPARVWRWLLAAAAPAFLAGAAGYVLGARSVPDPRALDAVDVGFLVDMTEHHDQAVELALLQLANGEDPIARDFATEVLLFQRKELGQMAELLVAGGELPPERDPARTTMAWMDMPTPAAAMPGMASPEQLAALADSRGPEADERFLRLMREHHRGGLHMASYAAEHAGNPRVRELAGTMARNQQLEVREYTDLLRRRGLE